MKIKDSNYNIRNILGYQKKNTNEFYTPKEPIEYLIKEVVNIPKNKVIWCPFDTKESNFVKVLKENGYKVIFSHYDENTGIGNDFYKYEPKKHWDLIISNPPFSKKRILIERCINFNKPFCLLYGSTIFSQSMGDTLNKCEFYFLQRNIRFSLPENKTKAFQCCWLFNKEFKKWKL